MGADIPAQNNAYLIDARSGTETVRLVLQDQLVTLGMGGLFPEHIELARVQRVLDLACGPAGWILNVAFQFPEMQVVGVDVNPMMIEYARAQAEVQHLTNARFEEMDVLNPLKFPDASFDLVNARFLVGFMPTTAWPALVEECRRILRPGGILCLTEGDAWSISGSPALVKLSGLTVQAMSHAGKSFATDGNSFGISPLLARFLQQAGFGSIKMVPHVIDFSIGTPAYEGFYENFTVASTLLQPSLIQLGIATQEELARWHERLLIEMRSDGFSALWYILRVCGIKARAAAAWP
jgi:ubiquinone/menaquinone biosynthesis C-methylase UbiE